MIRNTSFWELQNLGATRVFYATGLFGGYPGSCGYVHNLHRPELGDDYPVADGSFEEPALMAVDCERREYKQDNFTTLHPFEEGDLYLSVMKGAAGLGDPLLRPAESVRADVDEGHLLPRFAESVYGLSDREAFRRARLERARPVAEWWAEQRERVLAQDAIEPVKVMYAECMRLSPRWAAEYRGFWDLPEDFEWQAVTPTVSVSKAARGKVTPEESVSEYLASSAPHAPEAPRPLGGRSLEQDTLADMLDEKLSRRAVKAIQSGFKDPDRFDKWVAVLQQHVPYDDPIVLPAGEGLNIVRSGEDLVIRCDCGHDFCAHDRNWKMEAVLNVRADDESMREVYPAMAHADPDWMELREYFCPSCGRQLEVEAVPPGFPVVHEFLPDVKGFYEGWLGRPLP
jgi:acetone carboxylase gamma subunit